MKIKVDDWRPDSEEKISEFVANNLSSLGLDEECDELDKVNRETENLKEAFGRLCEVLAKKEALSPSEVVYVATGRADKGLGLQNC